MKSLPALLQGVVTHYQGNGRKFGYPTANIASQTKLQDGVYFGYADLDVYVHHPAVIFIGTPTTVGDTERRVETHLFDIVDHDYYGEKIKVKVMAFHRANKTFGSIEELLDAMKEDEAAARLWAGLSL
mgnify:CR=1 FL=1